MILTILFLGGCYLAFCGLRGFLSGCSRPFADGRKCSIKSCPNSDVCQFSKFCKAVEPEAVEEVDIDV